MYSLETITPEIAEQYLKNNKSNRSIRKAIAEMYAREMRSGNWKLIPQPISFDSDGNLVDGQHRLTAVIISRMPQEFHVFRGLSKPDSMCIDCGAKRNNADLINLATDSHYQNIHTSVCRAIIVVNETQSVSPTTNDVYIILKEFEEEINFACDNSLGNKRFRIAPVLAAIVHAYHFEDKNMLVKFLHIFVRGIPVDETDCSSIFRLRNVLATINKKTEKVYWQKRFRVAQRAIQIFCSGKTVSRLVEPSDIIYKLKNYKKIRKQFSFVPEIEKCS